ncbi:hypothetical protein ACQPXT_13275 [Streptomyces sp. CA-100214]
MRYYLNDATGGWMTASGDTDLLNAIPDGYREVTEAEYNEAAGTIIVELPPEPPAEEEQPAARSAAAVPAKAKRKAK